MGDATLGSNQREFAFNGLPLKVKEAIEKLYKDSNRELVYPYQIDNHLQGDHYAIVYNGIDPLGVYKLFRFNKEKDFHKYCQDIMDSNQKINSVIHIKSGKRFKIVLKVVELKEI